MTGRIAFAQKHFAKDFACGFSAFLQNLCRFFQNCFLICGRGSEYKPISEDNSYH